MIDSVNAACVDVTEFPFVDALPKRERKRVATVWERWEDCKLAMASKGTLIPATLAAALGDVHRSRIPQLCDAGKLERVVIEGHVFVTEASFLEWVRGERKTGRPFKAFPEGGFARVKAAARVAIDYAKESQKKD